MNKTVVVLGMMGRTPFAGVAWQVLHYLEGLRRLGCNVYYVEDTGHWPYDPEQNAVTDNCDYTVGFIGRLMEWCGLRDRWAYCADAESGRVFGLSEGELAKLFARADGLINVTGATILRDEHLRVPIRIYLETDPVLPQVEVAKDHEFTVDLLSAHTHHFTFGENIGNADCGIPITRFDYQPTRQPVVLDWWEPPENEARTGNRLRTISSWEQSGKDCEWNGEIYLWSKHLEFLKFIDFPLKSVSPVEIALASEDPEVIDLLTSNKWRVVDAFDLSKDPFTYRDYILGSRGEFTVAKDQYVRLETGWFSDRSVCFLAAGKPVVTQETGFSTFISSGKGLFGFRTMEDALTAVEAIEDDYAGNCRAAREVAEEYFAAEKVLGALLERAGF